MADITELFERVRRGDGGGFEELVAALSLMQGQLDPNSFLAGMLAGRSFHRSRWQALLPLILSMNAAGGQQQAIGTTSTTTPFQNILPLMLLFGKDDWDWREREDKYEIVEKTTPARATKS